MAQQTGTAGRTRTGALGTLWRDERRAATTYLLLAGSALALVTMRQVSALLSRLEANGESAGTGVLTRPQLRTDPLRAAGEVWSSETAYEVAGRLLGLHVLVDCAFVVLYVTLLARAVRWANGSATDPIWKGQWAALALVAAADLAENAVTWDGVVVPVRAGQAPGGAATGLLLAATWVKWLSVLLVLLLVVRAWVARTLGPTETLRQELAEAVRRRIAEPRGVRVWRRLRVQVAAVAALAVLVALPAGGPLDQLPDILRLYTDDDVDLAGELAASFLTLGLFVAALWVAGRWALLDDAHGEDGSIRRQAPARAPLVLVLAGVALLVVALLLVTLAGVQDGRAVQFNGGLFALPALLLLLGLLAVPARAWTPGTTRDPVDVPGPALRDRVRRAGRLLAALPVAIAGMGFVRAFLDPVLVLDVGAAAWAWLVVGVLGVLVGTPACYVLLALIEVGLCCDPVGAPGPPPASRRTRLAFGAVVRLVAGVAAGLAVWAALSPLGAGPWLNATGSITVLLSLLTLAGGWAQRGVEERMSYEPTRKLGCSDRTPVLALAALVVVLAGVLNVQGGYHQVRLVDDADTPDPARFDLADGFRDWLAQAQVCGVPDAASPGGAPLVPLVLVAAPGGGIRAAYWVDEALHAMARGDGTCAGRRVFAASGVSGGSLGLVAHHVHDGDAAAQDDHVTALSGAAPLAADVAAMFFRDAPAALLGISAGWPDRAAALEDAWARLDPALGDVRLVRDLQPGPLGADAEDGWRPLLLLNGTEVSTGCRVVVSPVRVVASSASGAPGVCRHAQVEADGDGVVEGAVDVLGFRDERPCAGGSAVDDGDLRAVTAALLSARFPYVSPSAELFACVPTDGGTGAVRASDLDGGAADNSALATTLDLWDALEPVVAAHNAAVDACSAAPAGAACPGAPTRARVLPLLVVLENHYRSTAAPDPVDRQPELAAPVGLLGAAAVLSQQAVLEQEALVTFGGPLPGVADGGADAPRVFRVNPQRSPGVAAPLGWTLSDLTRADLDEHLARSAASGCSTLPGTRDGDGDGGGGEARQDEGGAARVPEPLGCYLQVIGARD